MCVTKNRIWILLSEALQLHGEVAHQWCLLSDSQTTSDGFAAIIDILQSCCDHLHMVVGIYTTRDTQTYQIQTREAILAGLRIAVRQDIANLARTDTSLQVELASQCLSWELLNRHMSQYLVSIHEDSVTTRRALVRDTILVEQLSQILHLVDTCL